MTLPKITSTTHSYKTLKGEKILYSQFTGAHEKMLLEAKESENEEIIVETVLSVLRDIVKTGNVDKLPVFEVENLLLQSRIVSIGSDVEVIITDPETQEKVQVNIDLAQTKLIDTAPEGRILLGKAQGSSKDVYLNLRYPTFSDISSFFKISDDAKIRLCLDTIEEGDSYTDISDASDEELTEWLMSLEKKTIKTISDFVEKIPKLELAIEYRLKDGTEKKIILKDFKDFFM